MATPPGPKEFYEALVLMIKAKIPGFEVRFKNESRLQRFIGAILFFNRAYMTNYITTLYPHVYFPTRADLEANYGSAWRVLAHEYVHLCDNKVSKLGFRFKYLAPQILAVFSLGAIFAFLSLWFLLALVFLLALAPWPSSGRTWAELRGYTMSLAVDFWPKRILPTQDAKEEVIAHFTGWDYYRMCPNATKVRAAVEEAVQKMNTDALLAGPGSEPYVDVYELLKQNGLISVPGAAHA